MFKPTKRDIEKMYEYYCKGSDPRQLANTVGKLDKAEARYFLALSMGWNYCADQFYRRCLTLGADEETLESLAEEASFFEFPYQL